MEKTLLQETAIMRTELVRLVEQGNSVQAGIVMEKSQALDVLIAAYFEQQKAIDWRSLQCRNQC